MLRARMHVQNRRARGSTHLHNAGDEHAGTRDHGGPQRVHSSVVPYVACATHDRKAGELVSREKEQNGVKGEANNTRAAVCSYRDPIEYIRSSSPCVHRAHAGRSILHTQPRLNDDASMLATPREPCAQALSPHIEPHMIFETHRACMPGA
jgi:hypothetical protein